MISYTIEVTSLEETSIDFAFAVDVIPVSAKFLRPLVWSRLLIGVFEFWYVIGLFTVYERFW